MAGRIELITGPMYSGKTTELLMRHEYYWKIKKMAAPLVLVPGVLGAPETRWLDLALHDGGIFTAERCDNLEVTLNRFHDYYKHREQVVMCIDEVQFFPPEAVTVIEKAAREWGWTVICAGLNADFTRRSWETVEAVRAIANAITVLRAQCAVCSELGAFTQRLHLDGTPARADEPRVVLSGDGVRYEPRCWRCHVVLSTNG